MISTRYRVLSTGTQVGPSPRLASAFQAQVAEGEIVDVLIARSAAAHVCLFPPGQHFPPQGAS